MIIIKYICIFILKLNIILHNIILSKVKQKCIQKMRFHKKKKKKKKRVFNIV